MSQFSLIWALVLECIATEHLQEMGTGNQVLSFNTSGDENEGKISIIVLL